MADKAVPLIQLEPGGKAPILSYDVPEPTVYSGRNYIGLFFDQSVFIKDVLTKPQRAAATEDDVRKALTTGHFAQSVFPNVRIGTNKLSFGPGRQWANRRRARWRYDHD